MNLLKVGSIEYLVGSAHDDDLLAIGLIGDLHGGAGNDTLTFSSPDPASSCVLYGGAGNDLLIGQAFGVMLRGGRGNDTLIGAGNFNDMFGGPGHDTFVIGHGRFSYVQDFQHGIDRVVVPHDATVQMMDGYTFIHEGGRTVAEMFGAPGAHDLIFA